MYIKHLIGARKGEIEDLPFEVAKHKVEAAEAEDVYRQLPVPTVELEQETVSAAVMQPEVVSARADAVTIGAHAAKKKLRR